jgi:lactoylglutathione lyase
MAQQHRREEMILGTGHTAYAVGDLEAALKFYVEQLGLEEAFRIDRPDGSLWIIYIYAGNGSFIELFPEDTPPDENKGSYKHLCLQVDDMNRTLQEMSERGIEPLGPSSVGMDGNTQAWFADPDGNKIELMQISPDSLQGRVLAEKLANR